MFIRWLLLGFALYFAAKIVSGLGKPKSKTTVKGTWKNKPLDIDDDDVIDVDFTETKDE